MSENTMQGKQDQLLRAALKELEKNKDMLTGRTFRKWYRFPLFPFGPILLVLAILVLFDFPITLETQIAVLLATVLGAAMAGVTIMVWGIDNVNKRIDKIVELTGAERKLEEKYKFDIRIIAGTHSENENN